MHFTERIDRKRAFRGILSCWPLLFILTLHGCNGCKAVDYPVSSSPNDPGGSHRSFKPLPQA